MIRVHVYQPVVPEYRVPLFNAVSERDGLELTVHASGTFPGSPPKATSHFRFSYVESPSWSLWANSLFWQAGQRIPNDMAAGDVVVACGNPRVLSTYGLVFRALRRRIGVVWWSQWRSRRLSERIRRHIMKVADVMLLYNDREVQEAVESGLPASRLFATNNAVDAAPIEAARRLWDGKRLKEFQAGQTLQGEKTVLFCGRLAPRCKLPLALEALALLRQRGFRLQLVVIGDGPARSDFVSAAENLQVRAAVHWCGAMYDHEQLAPWFLSASAFVFPGTIGLSLLQAFAYGLPVITHGDPLFHGPEFAALRDGWNGLLFRRGDACDLAAKLEQLLMDEPTCLMMHRNALATVRDQYSMEAMVERFVQAVMCASAVSHNRR